MTEMLEKSKRTFDAQNSLKEVHLSTLQGQSSVYGSCRVPNAGPLRPERLLVSTLARDFRIYSAAGKDVEYQDFLPFYLPQDCQIISMDLFTVGSPTRPTKYITGITWSNTSDSSYFFNVYESTLDYENLTCISSIELAEWVPFYVGNTLYDTTRLASRCFLISGSDCRIHAFLPENEAGGGGGAYVELSEPNTVDKFPEFTLMESIGLWIAFTYKDGDFRVTAIAQENGTLLVFVVDLKKSEIKEKYVHYEEGPLTRVTFFENSDSVDLFCLASLAPSKVFRNILEHGLVNSTVLPLSDEFDVPTCCALADIDFDGQQEILMGTYGEELLVYKKSDEKAWKLQWSKSFNNPIHGVFHLDLTNDGVKELVIVTAKTVIILQHDLKKVLDLCHSRLRLKS